ncbi:MAG: hypothetical protein IPQ07_17590 [Myxococcales bacterium]|nr:hypothetical protein [Myxococcales bacterium]
MPLNVVAAVVVGTRNSFATVWMQASNASPSEGADEADLSWPEVAKLADTVNVTTRA